MATELKKCVKQDEDRKADLEIQLAFVCDEYDLCVAASGPTDPQCLLLLSIKQQVEAELVLVCEKLQSSWPELETMQSGG